MTAYTTRKYDTARFCFVEIIHDLFCDSDLDMIHTCTDEEYTTLFEVGHDSSTVFHKKFYDKYRAGWQELQSLYDVFAQEMGHFYFNEDFLYQSFPTFRVHLPHNVAVGAFHNDGEFHHPEGEVNFIIPLTNSKDTASCWVESEPGKKDFIAMEMNVGELIMFNGNELTHGNKVNETGKTRVSMDFRILPLSKYDELNVGESITRNVKFQEGKYYKRSQ